MAAALQDFKAAIDRLRGRRVYAENTVTGKGLLLTAGAWT